MRKYGLDSRKIGYVGTFQRLQFDFWEVGFIFGKGFPSFDEVFGSPD